jgi:hypothetical protein
VTAIPNKEPRIEMKTRLIAAVVTALFAFGTDCLAQQGPGTCQQPNPNCPQQRGPGSCNGSQQGQRLRLRTHQLLQQQQQQAQQQQRQQAQKGKTTTINAMGPNGPRGPGAGTGTCPLPSALDPTVQTALQAMLASELQARDFYLAAAQAFSLRSFTNMAAAEQSHADALARILAASGATPVLVPGPAIALGNDLTATYAIGLTVENSLIAGYDALIQDPLAAVLVPMLTMIRNGEARHVTVNGG